ncbi:MAG: Regulatory protein AtoC [Calditrichaeota bacterium]|nr:Regulatory protein AtoC [Calditrichota bacterium]
MPVGIIVLDLDGRINLLNEEAQRLTGVRAADAVGRPYGDIFPCNINDPEIDPRERRFETAHGRSGSPVRFSTAWIYGERGQRIGVLEMFEDMTVIKEMHETMRRRSDLATLGEISAQVAHEPRNPLAGVQGFAQFLLEDIDESHAARKTAQKIINGVRDIERIASRLLEYTRPLEPQFSKVDLIGLLRNEADLIRSECRNENRSIDVNLVLPKEKVQVDADANLLKQAVLNVLKNAAGAVGEAGRIELGLRWNLLRNRVSIWVEDDGPGIAPDIVDKIFNPFFTTRTKGTGLDLAMIITDLNMPRSSGMDVLAHAVQRRPETPVIILTAYGSIENAVEAMKKGAHDYITKPIDLDLLKLTISRSLQRSRLMEENRQLRTHVEVEQGIGALIGSSGPMQKLVETLEIIAPQPVDVLVTGTFGTGKELVARGLHWSSPRHKHPFIKLNCAALPENLIESELFGHEKGAFTGAIRTRKGKFEAASGGTILLDEISEMPAALQAKLLRVLQEREFDRVGSNEPIKIDVRVVATTNRNLAEEVKAGNFREDLFFRLNVVPLEIPPLASRREDIPELARHFLIERAVVLAGGLTITLDDVTLELETPVAEPAGFGPIPLAELEKRHIIQTLRDLGYNRTRSAERLGISIRTPRNKLNEYRDQGEPIPKG